MSLTNIPSVLVEIEAECSALVREFGLFQKACPERAEALKVMQDRHKAMLDRLATCRRIITQPVQAGQCEPVRWQYGKVYIDRTRYGFAVVSAHGAEWSQLGGWDAPPQPSNRDNDWYQLHNYSNWQAALQAAMAANDAA